ncbi:MAG: CDP-alcohol phosphatidyltransferase family protein [Methanobacterium sp.]|uniref:CDP-alcohol phosphatidyltransferase family protein n=1 Tax=Methanobacterium sp. TaxID=2164 RepID=UPI003D65E7BB|nr:CDP-alcohol phosphatidyltransferase family protein [Methanobacterium sp.]
MKINKSSILNGITTSRIVFAFIFLYLFVNGLKIESIAVFLVAILTDVFDGYFARKFDLSSSAGAYFDIIADFILVLIAFTAFILHGIYPYWLLILISLVFLQFIVTSKYKLLIYDPIGKYYGAFLFLMILITLIVPTSAFYDFLLYFIIIFTVISLMSRYLFFIFRKSVAE